MPSVKFFLELVIMVTLLFLMEAHHVLAMTASPIPFREQQPDGTMTPNLFIRGNPRFYYMADSYGYTVVQDNNNTYVYAAMDEANVSLVPTTMVVGQMMPTEMKELTPHAMPSEPMRETMCGRICQDHSTSRILDGSEPKRWRARTSLMSGQVERQKNLVLLIRFADHSNRDLPTPAEYMRLFSDGGNPGMIPGTVQDYFRVNSYGKFELESGIHGWVTLPKTESYYADGRSGLSDAFLEALEVALQNLDSGDFPWSNFDGDGDGFVDTLTLIHSGYAAEWGTTDDYGQSMFNRIWSHQWNLPSSRRWTSKSGIAVDRYVACPGLWDTRGFEIGRIGVIVHELGHSLGGAGGLPDLYGTGTMNDAGIGSFGAMGNSWGFDNSQRYPPLMCPWSKAQMGWSRPTTLSQSGTYTIDASAIADQVYRINLSDSETEYLLVENRQPVSFDVHIPLGGLAIWHIDEEASHREVGFPGQSGWPENGKHYRVALLQADGKYDLEKGTNLGDKGDLFEITTSSTIGPSQDGITKYPNTDSYQRGIVKGTGVEIRDISASAMTMKFTLSIANKATANNELTNLPIQAPTIAPTVSPNDSGFSVMNPLMMADHSLGTSFNGGIAQNGNMFDVLPFQTIVITSFDLHISVGTPVSIEVYTKLDSFRGHEKKCEDWTLLCRVEVHGNGSGLATPLPPRSFEPLLVERFRIRSFYITTVPVKPGGLLYSRGEISKSPVARDDNIAVFQGIGKTYPCKATFPNRVWNGVIHYFVPDGTIELTTTFVGGRQGSGIMFNVVAKRDIEITGMDIHVASGKEVTLEIYSKSGSYEGHENDKASWNSIGVVTLLGRGLGQRTPVPEGTFSPIIVDKNESVAFYITLTENEMRYSDGKFFSTYDSNDDLTITKGIGIGYRFGETYPDRVFNGVLRYERV